MNKLLVIASASVFVLGMAGAGYAADQTTGTKSHPGTMAQTQSGTTTATPASPVLASEDQIKQAQQHLKNAGIYKGTVDGEMGAETKQAIQQFQQQHGLSATGNLDQQTMAAIEKNTSSTGSSTRQR